MKEIKLLLHTCCAPCSTYVIKKLRGDGYNNITSFWYNINIHPYMEYKQRLETLKEYTEKIDIPLIVEDNYGLKEFCKNVIDNLDERCYFCYLSRLEHVAKYTKEKGYDAFSTTLLVSPYQRHELIKQIAEEVSNKYNIKFIYQDFREGFREGQSIAREEGLYTQKYCGCIFSEEERYLGHKTM